MRGRAYAKINLTLEVTGKRPDGFHELVSVMQTVSLADSLSLSPASDLTLSCDRPELTGDDNLVLRAARLLGKGGHFRLEKHIPIAAGLGGGSSDAALALRLLDAVYGLGLPPSDLCDAAAQLGSDVPFFLSGGTALAEGRGERITALPDLAPEWLVLLNPGVPLSTPAVYRELRPDEWTDGAPSRGFVGGARVLTNSLEAPALRLEPAIAGCREALRRAGAEDVLLSGSGPTVFGLAQSEDHGQRIAQTTGGIAARFVSHEEALRLEG